MKKAVSNVMIMIILTVLLSMTVLCGCSHVESSGTTETVTEPAAEPVIAMEEEAEAETKEEPEVKPEEEPVAEPEAGAESATGRQDGERFEDVIMLEGTDETVRYEHAISKTIGFEIDYDYESFERHSEPDLERFISIYDDPEKPESYLEVKFSPEDPDTVLASYEAMSGKYEIEKESYTLDGAGSCMMLYINEAKDDLKGSDPLQTVYIIPASGGSLVATEHYTVEGQEGFGSRLSYIMNTLVVIDRE